jgi:hypothetical protein
MDDADVRLRSFLNTLPPLRVLSLSLYLLRLLTPPATTSTLVIKLSLGSPPATSSSSGIRESPFLGVKSLWFSTVILISKQTQLASFLNNLLSQHYRRRQKITSELLPLFAE